MLDCPDLAVPQEVMQHVVHVESSRNPYAIGVVGGYLARQPRNLEEALATVKMLKSEGYNFSVGIAQVNRYNLAKYGLQSYSQAFEICPNLRAGSRILRECYDRAQDWGKAFSCYYSGNFVTGFEHGYVQKIFASMRKGKAPAIAAAPSGIEVIPYKNSKAGARKPAKDDGLALEAAAPSAAPAVAPAAIAVPQVAAAPQVVTMFGGLAVTVPGTYPEPYAVRQHQPSAGIAAPVVASRNGPLQDLDTAEDRPAIPVPGPGAVMPDMPAARVSSPSAAASPAVSAAARAGSKPAKPSSSLADLLAKVPVEVVGVNGDPRQTRLIGPVPGRTAAKPAAADTSDTSEAAKVVGTAGLPADQLPLPDPNAVPGASGATAAEKAAGNASGVEDVGKLVVSNRGRSSGIRGAKGSVKGGSLLHASNNADAAPVQAVAPAQAPAQAPAPAARNVFTESSASPEKTAATVVPTRASAGSSTETSDKPQSDGSDTSFVF
jgi:type IV secretion system protein VirB1